MGPSVAFFLSVCAAGITVMEVSRHRKQEVINQRLLERAVIWAEIAHLLNDFASERNGDWGERDWVERVEDLQRNALYRLEEFYNRATGR
jgi:hypothetical protein